MNDFFSKIISLLLFLCAVAITAAQDTVRYTGPTLVNVDYHHGQLTPAVGVHNIQVFRANRQHPEAGTSNWTYSHQPMLAYWRNQFYLQYLSNPVGEHVPPGQTLLINSKDGYHWSKPVIIFPPYKIPDGTKKPGRTEVAKDLYSVNHQRMGFYVSREGRLLTLAFYGIVLGAGDDHIPDGRVVGLWKNALTSVSKDEGRTWMYNPLRAPKFVNSNAKIWGQKTSDGNYATVYNPSEFRWPLAISVSNDGLNYHNLLLVNGEISTMRYGGAYKSYGPQYVRGITEGDGNPPDGNLWVTYSMNKEDIWIASIPVPVQDKVTENVNEVFDQMPQGKELNSWNYNSGLWTPVGIEKMSNGTK